MYTNHLYVAVKRDLYRTAADPFEFTWNECNDFLYVQQKDPETKSVYS